MEYYFTTHLTETEHEFVEHWYIRPFCKRLGLEVLYYRKFKTGHVPCERECKIKGFTNKSFSIFKKWCETRYCPIELENYWKKIDLFIQENNIKYNSFYFYKSTLHFYGDKSLTLKQKSKLFRDGNVKWS